MENKDNNARNPFTQFEHVTIGLMSARTLIAVLCYYNEHVFPQDKCISFRSFVSRCVEVQPHTDKVFIHKNDNAKSAAVKYGFVTADHSPLTVEEGCATFNTITPLEHAFYFLYASEEAEVVEVLRKAEADN